MLGQRPTCLEGPARNRFDEPMRRRSWWDGILVVTAPPERDGSLDWPRVPLWFAISQLKMLLFFLWVFVVAPLYVAIGLPIYMLWRLACYFIQCPCRRGGSQGAKTM
jgi:hypothetical protein